jgi:hypothetical protein
LSGRVFAALPFIVMYSVTEFSNARVAALPITRRKPCLRGRTHFFIVREDLIESPLKMREVTSQLSAIN